jgi:hypothetical protein
MRAYSNIKCLISIGTGVPSFDSYGSSLFEIATTLKGIATETEKTAESFHRAHSDLDDRNRCFRFNVSHGLEILASKMQHRRTRLWPPQPAHAPEKKIATPNI